MIQRWGKLPLMLLNSMDLKAHRYAYIGTEDWRMHPLLSPGSLVLIDETKRKILNTVGRMSSSGRSISLSEGKGTLSAGLR